MATSNTNQQLALVVSSNTTTSYEELLESQKELISNQICELQNIVSKQCKLTGVNPLSQEMAAGALSIKIGKRPRDLLNPKAIKYMQSIFSVKDEISKKEMRAISALFGLTATQVRDFFNAQRARVRRFIRLSREKAVQSAESVQQHDESMSSNVDPPNNPVPLNAVGPSSIEAPSCSAQDEVLPDTDESEKYFIAHIFDLLRKEETFSGQVKLMEWILQIQNASVLYWYYYIIIIIHWCNMLYVNGPIILQGNCRFLTNGGVMILASWLSQAATEEQTTVLHVILRVLCHLPLHKALPAHMSATLQSVNKLRFYRKSDISNRAKSLLSRWSKMFARSQAMRKPNGNISSVDAQNEMLLKQRQVYLPLVKLWKMNHWSQELTTLSQSIKLLTGPSDDSNMKLLRGVSSSHTRERRKVQLVEQPGQKPANRGPQVTRIVNANQGRPLSADDIQKAKMRAQFMRNKYGESYKSPHVKTEVSRAKAHVHPKVEEDLTSSSSMTSVTAKPHVQPKVAEHKSPVKRGSGDEIQALLVHCKEIMDSEEPVWKKCKRLQISWAVPPEMKINKEWSVCSGENSKEIDVQNNRIKREKEVFYTTPLEIPPNPKEPWDREMDYDDSLTPEIPTDQLPDEDDSMVAQPAEMAGDHTSNYAASTSTLAENNNRNMPGPDLELLAVLLKNPQIVFALTAGQGGSLTNEQMVKLLDAVKANAASGGSINTLVNGLVERKAEEKVEVSLPSPTPSSNPVTSGWRTESAKNPFSRQSVTVNGDPYAIPGVYYQETTQPTVAPITHQRFSNLVPDRGSVPAAINGLPTANLTQQAISPVVHQRFPDMVPDQRNIPAAGRAFSNAYYLPEHGGSQIQPQRQVVPEPRLSTIQSWAGQESLASSPYSTVEPSTTYNTYGNTYGTREFAQTGPSLAGPSRVRNGGYRDGPGFESWSPNNSPVRSHEYVDGWEYSDPHGRIYNHRPEMSRMQHDISRYRDQGGRNGGSHWRDRRR
ncbi:putative transcription factor homeobox-WOX family [Helianthus annuus]|nr:putative transcription factor homeobox-WOX family [Helianthus annuus]